MLVERRGEIVTREEIVERIWGKDVFLDAPTAINTTIRKILPAPKDNPDEPRFIMPVLAKEHRFVAPVIVVNGGEKPAPESSEINQYQCDT